MLRIAGEKGTRLFVDLAATIDGRAGKIQNIDCRSTTDINPFYILFCYAQSIFKIQKLERSLGTTYYHPCNLGPSFEKETDFFLMLPLASNPETCFGKENSF